MNFICESNLILAGVVTVVAVVSPGPDFAMIVRNSMRYGRKSGLATAMGIACGVVFHSTYILLGLSYIISTFTWIIEFIRYSGAAYLIWLGLSAFLTRSDNSDPHNFSRAGEQSSISTAFRNGLLCNILNPKTILFFTALFTQIIDRNTPVYIQAGLGLFIMLCHLFWFSFVSFALTTPGALRFFKGFRLAIEKIVGISMILLGARIAFNK